LIKALKKKGCVVQREGGKHTVWRNPETGAMSVVPRHPEIKAWTAKGIFKGLDLDTEGQAFH
jgi:predicted RNA binding protein YcfA (HicA-like mRNA interferase family)